MLKIGVLGLGHLGKIHIKCIQLATSTFELVGFYDPDDNAAAFAEKNFGIQRFTDLDRLIDAVDIILKLTNSKSKEPTECRTNAERSDIFGFFLGCRFGRSCQVPRDHVSSVSTGVGTVWGWSSDFSLRFKAR